METYFFFFIAAAVAAYVVSVGILALGKPDWDIYFLAVPVGIVVGWMAVVWVSSLRAYTLNSHTDLWLALVLVALGSAIMAEARHEYHARRRQDPALLAWRRWGVTMAQLVLLASAMGWSVYWLMPKLRGFVL